MKLPLFRAALKDQRISMWIYVGVMFFYGMLIMMAFLSVEATLTDPFSEAEGIVLSEIGNDEESNSIFNLTWETQAGIATHVAIGFETNESLTNMDIDMENVPGFDPNMVPDSLGRTGSKEEPVIPMKLTGTGIELIYFGEENWVNFVNSGSSKFFVVGLIPNDWNLTNITYLGPVTSTELMVGSDFDAYLEDNPMMEAFFGEEFLPFTEIDGFLALEYFSLWPLMLMIFIAIKSGGAVSKHVDDQSIDILLATGYSRVRFLSEKILVIMVNLVLVMVAGWSGIVLGILAIGEPVPLIGTTMTFLGSLPMVIGIIGLALVLSVLIDEGSKTTGAILGLTIFMFMIQIVSNIAGWGDSLGYISLFRYYNVVELMSDHVFDIVNLVVPLVIGIGGIVGAYILFWKKDIHA